MPIDEKDVKLMNDFFGLYDDLKNSHFVGKATGVTNTSEIQLMNVGMACLLTIKKNLKEEN